MNWTVLAALFFAAGCTPVNASTSRARDTTTIHNADATRIWLVEQHGDGYDNVVLCDIEMLKTSHKLCIKWALGMPNSPPPP